MSSIEEPVAGGRRAARRVARGLLAYAGLALLAACGGEIAPSIIEQPRVLPGPMPHAAEVDLPVTDPQTVEHITFRVRSAPGARARDVVVRFERSWLERHGAFTRLAGHAVIPVFGLYASAMNDVEIDIGIVGQGTTSTSLVIETPAEVPGILPWVVDQADPDLTLDYFAAQGATPPIVVDTDGAVRWCAPDFGEPVFPFLVTADGLVVGSLFSNAFHQVDWIGNRVNGQMQDARCLLSHHNLEPGKHGILNTVTWDDGIYMRPESVIAEMTREGELLRVWDFDHIVAGAIIAEGEDPTPFVQPGVDWFHMNSAVYDASDDSVIASSRENFVIKVDYATGAIRWILGNPDKLWFQGFPNSLAPLALTVNGLPPIGQHALSISDDGSRLMCFDNGRGHIILPDIGDTRVVSRVVEYVIDPVARTATEDWVFELDLEDYSAFCSSAYRTRAHDVLVASSGPVDGGSAHVLLVRDNGTVAFRASPTGRCDSAYRAIEMPWTDLVLE